MSAYFAELEAERCICGGEIVADGEHGPICEYGHEGGPGTNLAANVEPCADCGHPVYWSEPLGDWTHVNDERACWLHDSVHEVAAVREP